MKLAVFGATGTVGSVLLDKALAAGNDVRALARTPSRLTLDHPSLTVVQGDAKDPDAVARTLDGVDVVVSTLGGFADPDSISIGTAIITEAMRAAGLRRIVVVQGYHLDFPGDPRNLGRKLILPMLYLGSRRLVPDSREMARALQDGDRDWTVVRIPRVVRGSSTGRVRIGALPLGPWDSVVDSDVADLVLTCLEDPTTIRTAPMIASRHATTSERALPGVASTLRDIVRPPRHPEVRR